VGARAEGRAGPQAQALRAALPCAAAALIPALGAGERCALMRIRADR
jgi:hypothetical protein